MSRPLRLTLPLLAALALGLLDLTPPPAAAQRAEASVEIAFWTSIKDSSDPEDFREYLRRFPGGTFAGLAGRRLERLTGRPLRDADRSGDDAAASGSSAESRRKERAEEGRSDDDIERIAGYEFEGTSYAQFKNMDFPGCAERCAGEPRCRAIEHYVREQSCGLFDVVPPRRRRAGVDIGVMPRSMQPDGPAPSLRKLTRHYVKGEGYDTTLNSSWAECSARCLNDGRCRMLEFYKPKQKCNLFDHTRTLKSDDNDADIGIKE